MTTPGDQALANLDDRILATREALTRRPDVASSRAQLVGSLLTRALYRGTFSDFDEVDRLTQDGLAQSPTAENHRLRARYLGVVHLFELASTELDRAAALGDLTTAEDRGTHDLATGRDLRSLVARREAEVKKARSYVTLSALAAAHAAVGEFTRADELYREALDVYPDVSPFPVAWTFFQRGVMWAEMADRPEWARPLYEEAVRRLPGYISANVHLAELEFEAGETTRAIDRLKALLPSTEDPEPLGRLAEWTAGSDPEASRTYAARARAQYDALIARHPRAFLDHASEFFAAAGADPARALTLAEENLKHRRNARAFILAIEAATAAGRPDRACAIARDVPADTLSSHPVLFGTVREQRGCPRR